MLVWLLIYLGLVNTKPTLLRFFAAFCSLMDFAVRTLIEGKRPSFLKFTVFFDWSFIRCPKTDFKFVKVLLKMDSFLLDKFPRDNLDGR